MSLGNSLISGGLLGGSSGYINNKLDTPLRVSDQIEKQLNRILEKKRKMSSLNVIELYGTDNKKKESFIESDNVNLNLSVLTAYDQTMNIENQSSVKKHRILYKKPSAQMLSILCYQRPPRSISKKLFGIKN
jgi:hypothetical protein